jgi:predicted phosphoadenosine phosphosulfate sulfurtransferase
VTSELKIELRYNVLTGARRRISRTFDDFERIYVSFSGGKDSTVMLHLVMDEARRRGRKVGVLIIDLEAQYKATVDHMRTCVEKYRDQIDLYWVCLPMALRNAVSNFEPRWICWQRGQTWVRDATPADAITDPAFFPFFREGMEFEEFMVEFGLWYSGPEKARTAAFVGIRADESLNRFRTIASRSKETWRGFQWTTRVEPAAELYNVYPIYDWRVGDLWHYHYLKPRLPYNVIYDYMHKAGLTPSQMRLCQPYGDDQRRGLWLFHILEPQTWFKVVTRVSGANAGALYVQETGNVTGYNKITRPDGHTWKSYAQLLLASLPKATQEHYLKRFRVFIKWWRKRGYPGDIPDEAPPQLENKGLAPSYRRICKVLLRNDYWCKGLKFSQPKSEAYKAFVKEKKAEKHKLKREAEANDGKDAAVNG